jgi:hypothetical protein
LPEKEASLPPWKASTVTIPRPLKGRNEEPQADIQARITNNPLHSSDCNRESFFWSKTQIMLEARVGWLCLYGTLVLWSFPGVGKYERRTKRWIKTHAMPRDSMK